MGSVGVLQLVDRVVRIGLAVQALLVVALTALWSANVRGWISVKQLAAVFGPSAGWDLRLGLTIAFFALVGCLLFTVGILIVRSLLLIFDCSGLIGYVFREAARLQLPRSTRELHAMPAASVRLDALDGHYWRDRFIAGKRVL